MAFDYLVVIEQGTGTELARLVMTAATSHPAVGDDVEIDGEIHVVHKVRHVPHPHDASSRRAMIAEVHVRRTSADFAEPPSETGTLLRFVQPPRPAKPPSCALAEAYLRSRAAPPEDAAPASPSWLRLLRPVSPDEA